MIELFGAAQSVSMDQAVDILKTAGIVPILIGVLIGALIGGLIVGLILKLVAQAVLGHAVRYGSCFLAVFIATLVQSVIAVGLVMSGVVTVTVEQLQAAQKGGIEALMPYGLEVFVISQAIGLLILTWAIRTFVKSPSDASPPWGTSFVIAVIMAVIGLAFSYALNAFGVGR